MCKCYSYLSFVFHLLYAIIFPTKYNITFYFVSDDEVKRMWRNLRREFGKQLKRILKAGCETPETANPQWPYYHSLLFLKEQFMTTDVEDTVGTPEESDNFSDYYNYEEENANNSTASPHHSLPEANNSNQWKSERILQEQRRRMTQQAAIQNSDIHLEREKFEIQQRHQRAADAHDEDIGFFNSLLPHVRQLQPQQKMMFRMQIQQQLYGLLYGFQELPAIHSTSFVNQ